MPKKIQFFLALLLLSALILSGCSAGTLSENDAETEVGVGTPEPILVEPTVFLSTRDTTPVAVKIPDPGTSEWAPVVSGSTEFAFDMLRRMDPTQGNLVYSPISISSAFAMAYAGAEKDTANQMKEVLRYPLTQARFHPAFGYLLDELKAASGDDFTLNLANSLWGQQGLPFREDFLAVLRENYGAELGLLDFSGAAESARQEINDWVSDQTEDRLQDVLQPGSISSSTRLVLVNAIYFKALWEHPFNPDKTSRQEFDLLDGSEVYVDMMLLDESVSLSYAQGEEWQAVALPYKGGQAEMVIIMPDEDSFASFFSTFDEQVYESIRSSLSGQDMLLSMPKFSFVSGFALADDLADMGMPDAFDPTRADFSGMDGTTDLYIDDAYHLAFIDVDELGTEAGAATGIVMRSGLASVFHLVIDHPFFFVIRDIPTGTILFMGRVLNP